MRWSVFALSLIVLILGLVPLIEIYTVLPSFLSFIPRDGNLFYLVISIAGGILTYMSWKRM